jgi:predicted aminopeptidase
MKRFPARAALVAFLAPLLSSCWYLRQGMSLVSIYSSATGLEKALASGNLSPDERRLLETAREARLFAVGELGLADTKNYTSFVKTGRETLSYVVVACAADSFDQTLWDYPFVGKLPYKGFFEKAEAIAERDSLRGKGLDAMVREADAFSTLGILNDPLFSFMASYSTFDVAALIVHELTHATIFLPGQGEFDENLAEFVGKKGAEAYVAAKYGRDSVEYRGGVDSIADADTFARKLKGLYDELAAVYASKLERTEKLAEKAETIGAFKENFRASYARDFRTEGYEGFPDREIDNAYIMAFRTYTSRSDVFDHALASRSGDLAGMIRELKELPKKEKDPWKWLEARFR